MSARLAAFRPLVLVFAGFVLVEALTAAALFAMKQGLTPASIEAWYLGSEAAMTRARSLVGMLEVLVPHLLAVPLTLFVVVHLVGWAGVLKRPALHLLARVSFVLVAVGAAAGFGVRYVWPGLSVVKLAAFLGLELTLMLWVALLVLAFWPSRRLLEAAAELEARTAPYALAERWGQGGAGGVPSRAA